MGHREKMRLHASERPQEAPPCAPCSRMSSLQDRETLSSHLSCSSVVLCHQGPRKRTQHSFQQGHCSLGPGERGAPTGPQLLGSGVLAALLYQAPCHPNHTGSRRGAGFHE